MEFIPTKVHNKPLIQTTASPIFFVTPFRLSIAAIEILINLFLSKLWFSWSIDLILALIEKILQKYIL